MEVREPTAGGGKVGLSTMGGREESGEEEAQEHLPTTRGSNAKAPDGLEAYATIMARVDESNSREGPCRGGGEKGENEPSAKAEAKAGAAYTTVGSCSLTPEGAEGRQARPEGPDKSTGLATGSTEVGSRPVSIKDESPAHPSEEGWSRPPS
jgi:hypothetical protein